MSATLVDESGVTRFVGSLLHGVGSTLVWRGQWSNVTNYVPGDVTLAPNGGQLFLAVCVAANLNVDPFTDTGGTAKLGPHWYVEF